MAFIDYEKALGSVENCTVVQALRKRDVGEAYMWRTYTTDVRTQKRFIRKVGRFLKFTDSILSSDQEDA